MSAVVVGGGLAGLVAARQLLLGGESVDLLEADDGLGGLVTAQEVGGVVVDGGAEAFAVRTPVVADLCADLGLEVAEPQGQPHIWWPGAPHRWPMANGVLGIPGSLDDPAVLCALTSIEQARAARDVEMGGDVGAGETMLGPLVEARLGRAVVERLVEPVTTGVYGRPPDAMEVDVSAPGLRGAMRELGSLTAAVAALRQPGAAAVAQPVGGLFRLVEALAADIERRGGRIHLRRPVRGIARDGGRWQARTPTGAVAADRVVLAVGAGPAARLLEPLGVSFDVPPTHPSHQVLLTLGRAELADGPVGSGIIVGRPDPGLVARALTHYSFKWPWAAQPERHVVRLAYGAPATVERSLADASLLLGLELSAGDLHGVAMRDWAMPTALAPGDRADLGAQLAHWEGLAVTGAWVAGNGIAAVVTDAQKVAA